MQQHGLTSDDQIEIWNLMQEFNRAWLEGRARDIGQHMHPDMMIMKPGFMGEAARGRRGCVQSYEEFSRDSGVKDFREYDPTIDIVGSVAVATYCFDITYDNGGEEIVARGRDMFVFARDPRGEWRAMWRTIMPAK